MLVAPDKAEEVIQQLIQGFVAYDPGMVVAYQRATHEALRWKDLFQKAE